MNEDRKKYLLKQFENGHLGEEDGKELLKEIYDGDDEHLIEKISTVLIKEGDKISLNAEVWRNIIHKIVSIDKPFLFKPSVYRWLLSAAASLLLISFAYLYFLNHKTAVLPAATVKQVALISPAYDQAVLTLMDGRKITLDNNVAETLNDSNYAANINHKNGQLEVIPSHSGLNNLAGEMLKVETPRGGKYMIILPDGSKVWLNAASSIRFPAVFSKTSREVHVEGEAYFEVLNVALGKKENKWPFRVKTGKHIVEVLGTHFDVKAYDEENEIITTLLEGAVNVYHEDKTVHQNKRNVAVLKPGQQSAVKTHLLNSNKLFNPVVSSADIEKTMAWKNNLFRFKNADIHSIMRELARWYNVKVEYESNVFKDELTGYVSRDVPVEKVLKMLEATSNVEFTIKDRTILVKSTK